ncbi:VOC family protein [Nitratireductor sp. StC3]|uniref:VOC family protein n=1 Tax=Nitratireductor sp. StC3 TaxID=2126741 RepID=UPI000D0CBCC0|nr:VOC family protein [Nitratireductor sp. StC3]PSM19083.1 VOC family protein [Nitratireductor sp. StC3]
MTSFVPENAVVWAEIPVSDMERAKAFYGAVLDNAPADQNDGPNPMAVFACKEREAVSGHLYPGKPASQGSGNTIHLAVAAPLEDALKRVTDNGGTVVSPVIEIPAGRFAYCLDPDGNSIGIFCA